MYRLAGARRAPAGARTNLGVWDAIVGVKGQWSLGDEGRWFVRYCLDLGARESSLTWQAFTGIGYSFGWGDVTVAWRHLAYEAESGETVGDVDFDGPAIAASFRWQGASVARIEYGAGLAW
jgi:hypothetical protein